MKTNYLRQIVSVILFSYNFYLSAQPDTWTASDIGGGGAMYGPSINPFDPSEIYASCDMSVMFHSTDSAKSWNTIPFNELVGNKMSEVRFTNTSAVRYVLAIDPATNVYAPFRSADSGGTWTKVAGTYPGVGTRLYVDPTDPTIVIVGTNNRVWFSNNSGSSFSNVLPNVATMSHLAGVFFDASTIYIATNKGLFGIDKNGQSAINYKSHLQMGAATASEEMVSFSGAKSGNVIRFVGVTLSTLPNQSIGTDVQYFQDIYTIDYTAAANWLSRKIALGSVNKAYNIAMKPDDINTFYIGGQFTHTLPNSVLKLGTVFKTTNGGQSFSNVFLDLNNSATNSNVETGWQGAASITPAWIGSDWMAVNSTEGLTVSRNDINYLVRTDKSNVYISTNGGLTWKQRYVTQDTDHSLNQLIQKTDVYKGNGLQSTVAYDICWVDSLTLIASFADIAGTKSLDGGRSWSYDLSNFDEAGLKDASSVIKHPNGTLYAALGDVAWSNDDYSDLRLSKAAKGKLAYSIDNGTNWITIVSISRPILSVAINPVNSNELYYTVASELNGIGKIYRIPNIANPIPVAITAPPGTENRPVKVQVLNDGNLVCHYGARSVGGVFQASSGVFYYNVSTATWSSGNLTAMKYDVRSVTVDPNYPSQDVWLACLGNKGPASTAGVYRTVNRGQTWTPFITGVNAVTCTFHPSPSKLNQMYLCTLDKGLMYFTNTNTTPVQSLVSSYPFKRPQQVFFNPYNLNEVWVASFGNGLKYGYELMPILNIEGYPESFYAGVGNNSDVQKMSFYGVNMMSALNITVPAEFEISLDENANFGNSMSIMPSGGIITGSTFYLRFSPTFAGIQTGELQFSTLGLDPIVYPLYGGCQNGGTFVIVASKPVKQQITTFNRPSEMTWQLVPSPLKDQSELTITLPEQQQAGAFEFYIYDLQGKCLQHRNQDNSGLLSQSLSFHLDRERLNTGIYFFEVRQQNKFMLSGKLCVE